MYYCQQRELNSEEAVSLIVNGFVKSFAATTNGVCSRSSKVSWDKPRGKRRLMLKINNLKANVEKKSILNGFNLEIKEGEVHAIMGPNGSEKALYQYSFR